MILQGLLYATVMDGDLHNGMNVFNGGSLMIYSFSYVFPSLYILRPMHILLFYLNHYSNWICFLSFFGTSNPLYMEVFWDRDVFYGPWYSMIYLSIYMKHFLKPELPFIFPFES